MSRHPDFEPMKLFQLIDVDGNGQISAINLFDFMKKQYMAVAASDVEDIITEYDGTQNRGLDFDEFCQLVLPSANASLRHIAVQRRYSPYNQAGRPVAYEVLSLFTRLLDKEMALQRQRNESKLALVKCPDFLKTKVFDTIARGYHLIGMPELISYLEKNGFYPRREDIEAILRRMDHDANRMISYEEFCELASVSEPQRR